MKKFLKDTRGVVMMEYIILGCFAVAITAVTVLALGKVYNNGLATMAYATAGETTAASKTIAASKTTVASELDTQALEYAAAYQDGGQGWGGFDYDVFGTTTTTP